MSVDQLRASYAPDQVPVIIEMTQSYLVWVDDDDELGAAEQAKSIARSGVAYEYLDRHQSPIDGDTLVRAAEAYELYSETMGPWPRCAEPECQWLVYPMYGARRCSRHPEDES